MSWMCRTEDDVENSRDRDVPGGCGEHGGVIRFPEIRGTKLDTTKEEESTKEVVAKGFITGSVGSPKLPS